MNLESTEIQKPKVNGKYILNQPTFYDNTITFIQNRCNLQVTFRCHCHLSCLLSFLVTGGKITMSQFHKPRIISNPNSFNDFIMFLLGGTVAQRFPNCGSRPRSGSRRSVKWVTIYFLEIYFFVIYL